MKYLVVLCDGMADRPCPELSGKTPMEAANKPNMDFLAKSSEVGMCKTVAEGLKPGSDVANLSVLGYDPYVMVYYKPNAPEQIRHLQRWVNNKFVFRKYVFS